MSIWLDSFLEPSANVSNSKTYIEHCFVTSMIIKLTSNVEIETSKILKLTSNVEIVTSKIRQLTSKIDN